MNFRILTAAAVLAAATSSNAVAQDKETVTFMAFDVVNFRGALEEFIEEFEAANPDVDVVANFTPLLFDQFLPLLQANNLDDITMISSASFVPYLASGRLSPLPADYAARLDDTLYHAALAPISRDGELYAVPYNYYPSSGVIMYNEDLWNEAGVDPTTATTWEEFMTLAQAVTKRDDSGRMTQSGFAAQADPYVIFLAWLLQMGGTPFNADGTAGFNSEIGAAALQQYADIYLKWGVDDYEFGSTITAFNQGTVGASMIGPWYGSILAKDFPNIHVGHVVQPPLPGVAAGTPNNWPLMEVWAYLVSPAAVEKEGVYRFLDYLMEPEVAARWSAFSGEMPTVKAATTMPEVTGTPYIAPYVPALDYGVSENVTQFLSGDVIGVLNTMLESVARGQATIPDALATAETEVNRLTARMVRQ